ncbi:MAG TPA: hypothetical protein VNU72_04125, partial [Puia sp.]|nr:hypothetical protein [Puia sp.]
MKKFLFSGILPLILLLLLSQPILSKPLPVGKPSESGWSAFDSLHDGQHDFDFNIGDWKTHIRRRLSPYIGAPNWVELNGTVTVHEVWNGRAQVEEIEADGSIGHFEGMTLFLYNPTSQQWSQNFASSADADNANPTIGRFKDGRGELYGTAMVDGKAVMLQGIWSDILKDSHRYQESISYDGGKTWMPVFIADLTRDYAAAIPATADNSATPPGPAEHDGRHDFDFAFGRWKEHSTRLQHPLTGSTTWIQMDGISDVRKIWNGRGSLTELESDGPNGHLELLALRLYNPQSRQWNLTFATSGVGVLGMPPCVGEFRDGRGIFYDQELYNG